MTQEELDKHNALIIAYLYGDLDSEQAQALQKKLEDDASFYRLYQEQKALDKMVPMGSKPYITDARLMTQRLSLSSSLHRLQRGASLWGLIKKFMSFQVTMKVPVFAMACMFLLGFFINGALRPNSLEHLRDIERLSHRVQNSDYDLLDIKVDAYDKKNGDISFSYSLALTDQVTSNISDKHVLPILMSSLKESRRDNTRLSLVDFLSAYPDKKKVRDKLIFSLLNDPNPGVRYSAVETLVNQAEKPDVREALISVLAHDTNTGVRIEALQALIKDINADVLEVLRTSGVNDENVFIREVSEEFLYEHKKSRLPNIDRTTSI